jgi:hypothetical protein
MFVGHLAVALSAKKIEPQVPLAATMSATFGLDLLWPLFLLLGVESARVDPGNTAFTHLAFDSYPWSHSLVMAVGWAALATFGGKALFGRWRAGVVLGAIVLSHWFLDFITHRPDLPVWPRGPQVGLGLWHSVPATIFVEGSLLVAGLAVYLKVSAARNRVGQGALVALILVTGLIWISQPWSPPPPSATAVALGVATTSERNGSRLGNARALASATMGSLDRTAQESQACNVTRECT